MRLFRALDASPISVVITADLSRLARNMPDLRRLLSRFARRGVALIAVEESLDTNTTEGRRTL
jgi:DNA invertase Pin-like site-specific DNA recombinase